MHRSPTRAQNDLTALSGVEARQDGPCLRVRPISFVRFKGKPHAHRPWRMANLLDCCNRAIAEIAAGSISSLTDGSIEARECNRFAASLVTEISGWHEWGFAIVSVVLAQVTNDRPYEWQYAYALPSDMEKPLVIRRQHNVEGGGQITLPAGMWCGDEPFHRPSMGNFSFPRQDGSPLAYIIEGPTLYTNVCNAILHYWQVLTDVSQFPPMLARAFELELAARICLPLQKNPQLAQAINQQAEMQRQRAAADDNNRHPRPAAVYTSAAEYARAGLSELG